MPTPCLLIDQNGNETTRWYDDPQALVNCIGSACILQALPANEGLDRNTCYLINVRVSQ